MKKIFLLFVMAGSFAIANAQVNIGVKGGRRECLYCLLGSPVKK